jgi:hypothetical protein
MSPLVAAAWTALVPLADPVPEPDDVKPGWLAGVVVLLLIAATILLWMNMRKQLRKIRFDEPDEPDDQDTGTASGENGTSRSS